MALPQWIALAVLQAFAEVLPIGAAAQFSWLHAWTGLPAGGPMTGAGADPGLAMGVRLGLLLAIATYFWRDVAEMVQGLIKLAKGKSDPGARLAFQLLFASLPSVGVAVAVNRLWGTEWQTPAITAWSTVVVAVLLILFDRACMTVKRIEHAGYGDAFLLGCIQAVAIVPGVGRIAASVAMARLLGYERPDAARFSFLIWIPILAASCVWHAPALIDVQPFPTNALVVGLGLAFITALVLLSLLMTWLRRRGFTPFAVYRLLIGINLVAIVYGWL